MNLVHDALDAQVVDRHGIRIGRVDGIVLTWDDGAPPCVAFIELGPVPLAHRLHPRIGAWLVRWLRGRGSAMAEPFRVPWTALRRTGNDFAIDCEAADTPAWAGEHWTRERVVGRIPGA